jgi:predicted dehydrogenase
MKLQAGVIGLGIGMRHLEALLRHPSVQVLTVCDFSPEKLALARSLQPMLQVTSKADDVLCDPGINLVVIASHDQHHYDQVIRALQHGKHIFVEKPLCLSEQEARNIRQELQLHPTLRLSSNMIFRRYPIAKRLHEIFRDGVLGTPFLLEGDYNYGRIEKITEGWRGQQPFYSVTCGGGVHIVDLFLFLTQDRIEEVFTYGTRIATQGSQFRFDDTVASLLKFKGGALGKLVSNFGCQYPHFHRLCVYGTKGTFEYSATGAGLITSRDPSILPTRVDLGDAVKPEKAELLDQFVLSLLQTGGYAPSADEVFADMAVCFAVDRSLYSGRAEKVQDI